MKKLGLICFAIVVFVFCVSFKAVNSFAWCGYCDEGGADVKKAGSSIDAAKLFETHCKLCHGDDGKGKTSQGELLGARDFTDAKWAASITNEQIIKQINEGSQNLKPGEEKRMVGFKDKLSQDEIKALIPFVRAFSKKK